MRFVGLKTLRFTASGATFSVGQNFTANDPWPRITLTSHTALIDYEHPSIRQDLVREMGTTMPRGGVPFTGELHLSPPVLLAHLGRRVVWFLTRGFVCASPLGIPTGPVAMAGCCALRPSMGVNAGRLSLECGYQ